MQNRPYAKFLNRAHNFFKGGTGDLIIVIASVQYWSTCLIFCKEKVSFPIIHFYHVGNL